MSVSAKSRLVHGMPGLSSCLAGFGSAWAGIRLRMLLIRMDARALCLLPPAFNASFRPGQCWLSDSTAGRCRVPIYVMPTDSPLPWHPFPLLLPNGKAMTRDIKDLIVALDIGTSKVVAVVA